jgi:methylthioribose-1-phosphate isomerase
MREELSDPIPPTIEWRDGAVRMIDQRQLPGELAYVDARTVDELCDAIRTMVVRGAPALGVAGAMGVALAQARGEPLEPAAQRIVATRPTAANLEWGVKRALAADDPLSEARRVAAEDVTRNRALAALGAPLLPDGARVLTHCNAGSLACAGYGTALGIVRAAHESGRAPRVFVDETRPMLQGSRLTAWELGRLGVPATLVADSAAGSLMAADRVDCVVVGADRVAANGDVANKVGTYSLAVLSAHHGLPFYVAAPISTIDLSCPDGSAIPVEQRGRGEVAELAGTLLAPAETAVENPAFDVTPAQLVTAIVTEDGIARAPYVETLAGLARGAGTPG